MAFLTLAGVTVEVQVPAESPEPVLIGERVRSFNGTLRSTVRGEKASWHCRTKPLSDAELATVRATFAAGVPITVSGDALDNVATSGYVTETGISYIQDGLGFLRELDLTVEES